MSLLGQHTACSPNSPHPPCVGLKLRVRGASAAGAREGGGELCPLLWEPSLWKQQLGRVAGVAPWGQGAESGRNESAGWLADGALLLTTRWHPSQLRSLAGPSSASYSQWKLQETIGGKGALSAPDFPSWPGGEEGGPGTKMNRWKRYLVLVVGAQAVPGLWVVLSVPATEREGEGKGFLSGS